jgi:hypothetical protein
LFWTGLVFSGLAACGGDDDDGSTESNGGSSGTSGSSTGGTGATGGTSSTGGTSGSGGSFDAARFCADLCGCVGTNGGDGEACTDACPDDVAGGATRADCEGALDDAEEGVDACIPVCAALP